jgi:enoyl-CoA hydratase/carnithine racemase
VKAITQALQLDEADRDLGALDALVTGCFASEDYIEGRRAFMEKRKPKFTGS